MSDRLFDLTPTHLVDDGAERTRCGIALHNNGKKPYPYVATKHAETHVNKRGMVVCPECTP